MAIHRDLPDAQLHEPKGVASAGVDTVYVATGAGSGVWEKITSDSIDTSSIKNCNKQVLHIEVRDLANAAVVLVPFPLACTVTKVTSTITAAISGGDSTLTLSNSTGGGVLTPGSGQLVIAASGSGEGTIDTYTPTGNNTFTAGTYLKISSDGGPTGGTSNAMLAIEVTYT